MRQIRKPFLLRSIAVFLLFVFLNSIFFPTVSLALTNGDTQPEYTSYAEGNSMDMVNLLTGDMGFTLPLVEVPGPEGSFSIPLGYKAGIGLEQEASWVGLGFSLNPGAISRQIVQYPDDANGEINLIESKDPGIHGWSSSFLLHGQFGWNNITGHYGKGSLAGLVTFEYSAGFAEVGIAGIYSSGKFNGMEFTTGLTTLVGFGAAGAYTSGANFAVQLGKSAVAGAMVSGGFAMTSVATSPVGGINADWRYFKKLNNHFFYKTYSVSLDQTRHEEMFGILNLGKIPIVKDPNTAVRFKNAQNQIEEPDAYLAPSERNIRGPATDMVLESVPDYHASLNPSSLAKDNYSVMGPGISGSIEPYRLDIGSLSAPKDMSLLHHRYAPVPFTDYKVQYRYEGTASNSYTYHTGAKMGTPELNFPYYGINTSLGNVPGTSILTTIYSYDDNIFTENNRYENNREDRLKGLKNNKLSFGKNVEWYSNKEIAEGNTPGYIDFLPLRQRSVFRSTKNRVFHFSNMETNNSISIPDANKYFLPGQFVALDCQCKRFDNTKIETTSVTTTVSNVISDRVSLSESVGCFSGSELVGGTITNGQLIGPANGIGGYSITREDGITYHYTIPIYNYDEETKNYQVEDSKKYSVIRRSAPFATTWLLTGISGSDYVDRGQEGMDEEDWGYWVKLEYGKSSDAYGWRIPFDGTKIVRHSGGVTTSSYSRGKKQLYYLNSISTRSHTALFVKERREDGIGYIEDDQRYQYRLNEIVLLDNKSYKELVSQSNGGLNLGSNNMLELLDLTASDRLYLNEKTIKKISFSYSYKLCKGIPNSLNGEGKLTLERISFFGRKNLKIIPDYIFEYENSPPNYNEHSYDNWGYFGRFGNLPNKMNVDAKSWSIRKIITPLGSSIVLDYESDSYSSVGGNQIVNQYPFRTVTSEGDNWWTCSTNRYFLKGQDLSEFRIDDIVSISGRATLVCGREFFFNAKGRVNSVSASEEYIDLAFLQNDACSLFLQIPDDCKQLAKVEGEIKGHSVRERLGGGIRVAKLTVDDGGANYISEFKYIIEGEGLERSSGVVAQEPGKPSEVFDYPFTPVMYSKTTVLMGVKNGSYVTKDVFEFETPSLGQVNVEAKCMNQSGQKHEYSHTYGTWNYYLDKHIIIVDIYTAKIGAPKSITKYDKNNRLISSSEFYYSSKLNNNQGVFTEGTLLSECLNVRRESDRAYHRSIRTIKRYHPYVLTKIVINENGFITSKENKEFDFITGIAIETESIDPLGLKYKTLSLPAYHIYHEMGSKAETYTNSNMLIQNAATYSYRQEVDRLGIISASAQTWSKDFNSYRELANGVYQDSNIEGQNAWRIKENFIWKSEESHRDDASGNNFSFGDGSFVFRENNKFNFNSTENAGWRKVADITRFDHFSEPLEIKNITGNYSAVKQDLSAKLPILNVHNASYTEVAFTGFENGNIASDGNNFTDSEIRISSANQIDNSLAHTGTSSYKIITAGEKGVFYKISNSSLNKSFDLKRNYRLTVWVNSINNGKDNAELYYSITKEDNSIQTFSGGKTERNAGRWIMFDLLVPNSHLLNAKAMEVGVRKKSGVSSDPVYIDDFRFQPLNSNMTCYVYNTAHELEYTIDNNNLYSRFEYDAAGRVTATYIEVIGSQQSKERKVSSNSYNMAGID